MKTVNASRAAKIIGVSDRTLRRWLKPDKRGRVKLASTKNEETGQLDIVLSDVERLRQEVEGERRDRRAYDTPTTYGRRELDASMSSLSAQDIGHGLDRHMSDLQKAVSNLNTTVASQTRRIDELTRRVAELEGRYVPTIISPETEPSRPPTIANKDIPPDLPPGTLTSAQFRVQLSIAKSEMDTYIQRGISGETLPMTRIPHPTRSGYTLTYFTPEQQKAAIELLRRHNKI